MDAGGTKSVPDRYTVRIVMAGMFLFELLGAECVCACFL